MVVDDVENDAHAERMGALDEPPQIVGPAVQARRREQIHAVVPPAEAAFKIGDRHHLDHGDAGMCKLRQFGFGCECRKRTRISVGDGNQPIPDEQREIVVVRVFLPTQQRRREVGAL